MNRLNNFFFYLGLFTINAFRYNWDAILIPTVICGAVISLIAGSPWHFIPCFIGSYLAALYEEYKLHKIGTNDTE